MKPQKQYVVPGMILIVGLFLVVAVYWPGLSGSFIFDDLPNLSLMGVNGGIHDWNALYRFVGTGIAGPTGRPVSLLTFLIDGNNWPTSPEPFKYTNIMIQALNVCLVAWINVWVFRFLENNEEISQRAAYAAMAAAICWGIHPYLVSTTLYVVQRMAQLSAMFTYIGLLVYLKARWDARSAPRRSYFLLTIWFPLLGVLAFYSKENGALLPILAWVMEGTVVKLHRDQPRLNRYWKAIFLVLPTLLIAGYLMKIGFDVGWRTDYSSRTFSPLERLLTEPRIVWTYLYQWFVPHIFTAGVFHDNIVISKNLISPFTTAAALIGIIALICVAVVQRKSRPLVSLSIGFFLASQLIESTTVGLEIMFEHRVYLGSVFLLLPMVWFFINKTKVRIASAVIVGFIGLLSIFCIQAASLWGNYQTMTMVWAKKEPDSARAQTEAARSLYNSGKKVAAMELLNQAATRIPDDFSLRLTQVMIQCRLDKAEDSDVKEVLSLAGRKKYDINDFNLTQRLLSWSTHDCRGLPASFDFEVLSAFLSVPENQNRHSLIYSKLTYLAGVTALRSHDDKAALAFFRNSANARKSPEKLMNIAAYLATYGYYKEAMGYARDARRIIQVGKLDRKDLAKAPSQEDIAIFLRAVEKDQKKHENHKHSDSGEERG